jgi:hypothetical protein
MKKALLFAILLGGLLVAYYKWPFEMAHRQGTLTQKSNQQVESEFGGSELRPMKVVPEVRSESETKPEESVKTLPWTEKLNQCLGTDANFQVSSESTLQMADLYEKIRNVFGEPKEDSLILEETVVKWIDGEDRTFRWEPNKDFTGMGDLFWYSKDQEGLPEPLDLPEDLETPVSVEDYDRLVREGQMKNQTQSRFLKYDGGMDVGLMINNNEISGISLEYKQKEIHCQEKADRTVDCECLSGQE